MGRRGRKRDLDREVQYWEYLASGVGTVEACRLVGVSRKTGYRWRAEMGGVIARKRSEGSGRYLSMFERQRIASLHERGHGVRDIARKVGRSASTISRELTRNGDVPLSGGFSLSHSGQWGDHAVASAGTSRGCR